MARRTAINVIGVAFEGIGNVFGQGNAGNPLGSMFCTNQIARRELRRITLGDNVDEAKTGEWGYETAAYLLTDFGAADTQAEVFTSNMQFSSTKIRLHAHPTIAELFQFKSRRAIAEVVAISDPDDMQYVYLSDSSLASTYVYIGDETMYLNAYLGGDATNGYKYQALRGQFASPTTHHSPGTNVFDKVPYWRGRGVRIHTLELNGPGAHQWACRWAGRIDGGVRTNDDGTVIELTVREGLATLDQTFINLDQPEINTAGIYWKQENREVQDSKLEAFGSLVMDSRVIKPSGIQQYRWVQLGDGVYSVRLNDRNVTQGCQVISREMRSPAQDSKPTALEPHELFVVDRLGDLKRGPSPGDWYSSTRLLTSQATSYGGTPVFWHLNYPWHPLAIFAALNFSTPREDDDPTEFDVLRGPYWSASLKWAFATDIIERIHQLIQANPHIEVDRYVLGLNGEPVNLYNDIVRPLLHAFGYYFGLDDTGFLTIAKLAIPDVDTAEDATNQALEAFPGLLSWSDGEENSAEAVAATVGGLEWETPQNILVRDTDSSEQRSSTFTQSPAVTFDMRAVHPENQRISRDMLTNRMLMQRFGVPHLQIVVEDYIQTGQSYEIGKLVSLANLPVKKAVLVDKSGVRTYDLAGNEDFYGYIVGRKFDFKTRLYELTIMLNGDTTIRWRAPSMIVTSISEVDKEIFCSTVSQFGNIYSDNEFFLQDDEIQIWTRGGDLRDTAVATVTNAPSMDNSIKLSTWPFSTDPQPGDIVRLAVFGSYTNTRRHPASVLSYAYMGDDGSQTLPDGSQNHQFG